MALRIADEIDRPGQGIHLLYALPVVDRADRSREIGHASGRQREWSDEHER